MDTPVSTAGTLDALVDPVLIVEGDGTLRYANAAAERLFGYRVADWVGRSIMALVHPDERPGVGRALRALSRGRESVPPLELRVLPTDGSPVWVEVVASRMATDGDAGGLVVSIRDITARRALEAQRRDADARFQAAFDDAPIGMALGSLDGQFLQVNEALCEITGFRADELVGRSFQSITHPDDLDESLRNIDDILAGRVRSYTMEKRYLRADGTTVWITVSVSLVRDDNDQPLYFVVHIQDTTTRRHTEDALRHASFHDPLTGVANRRGLDHQLDDHFANPNDGPLAVVSCDLDDFKSINDRYGHAAGDAVLIAVAERLQRLVRSDDVVARVGGDEYVIVCPGATQIDAQALAARVRAAVEMPVDVGGTTVVPHISAGVAERLGTDATPAPLLARADGAMYDQKRLRRRLRNAMAGAQQPRSCA